MTACFHTCARSIDDTSSKWFSEMFHGKYCIHLQESKHAWMTLLSPRFFKKASGILQSPLSVCQSRYLLLNHWTKSKQIWCVCCTHEWGVQRHIFFGPGPGEGPKGQISLNTIEFQLLCFSDIRCWEWHCHYIHDKH